MANILVLYAHPAQKHSRANCLMADQVRSLPEIKFVDLYARYPRFKINVDHEQQQLLQHDLIVLQFPFYWYSTPALLKEWQDLVLEYGFAYGSGGDKLAGKSVLLAVTTGGGQDDYQRGGKNNFPMRTLLSPLEQTVNLCQMHFLPPLVLHSALDAASDARLHQHADYYRELLLALGSRKLAPASLQEQGILTLEFPLTGSD